LNDEENIKYELYDFNEHNYSNNISSINNINESDDTCYALFTSGTIENPKGSNSHFNLYSNIRKY